MLPRLGLSLLAAASLFLAACHVPEGASDTRSADATADLVPVPDGRTAGGASDGARAPDAAVDAVGSDLASSPDLQADDAADAAVDVDMSSSDLLPAPDAPPAADQVAPGAAAPDAELTGDQATTTDAAAPDAAAPPADAEPPAPDLAAPADLAPDAALPPVCNAVPSHPLQNFWVTRTFEDSGRLDLTAENGFRVTITIKDAQAPGYSISWGYAGFRSDEGGYIYRTVAPPGGAARPDGFVFETVLPAGSYRLLASSELQGAGATINRLMSRAVTICGDADLEISPEPLPALTSRNLSVHGLVALGSAAATGRIDFVLERPDRKMMFRVQAAVVGDVGTATIALPEGPLSPSFRFDDRTLNLRPGASGSIALTASAGDPFSFTLPPLATISGTVSDPATALTPAQFLNLSEDVQCLSGDAVRDEFTNYDYARQEEGGTGRFYTDALHYSFFVRRGLRCEPSSTIRIQVGPGGFSTTANYDNHDAFLLMPRAGAEVITVDTDLTRDFVLQRPPKQVKLDGKILDQQGHPLTGFLEAREARLTTPGWEGNSLMAVAPVHTDGAFTLNVLPGTYKLAFWPSQ
jgi:hypothetical protein